MKLCPEMDISMKREIKVFLKQTIYSGRLCKEPEVFGEREAVQSWDFSCGWGGRREQGTGNWNMHMQEFAAVDREGYPGCWSHPEGSCV